MNAPENLQDQKSPTTRDYTPLLATPLRPDHLERIGRYRIVRVLGEGGFGRVYLAHDDQLDRPVAIKVPRPERVSSPKDAEAFLAEARIVASLDHPHIVPVYDVGQSDGLCFVVSKLIEGSDLARRIQENPLTHVESADLIATAAEALHHAHGKGLVHRDIKPANILLDSTDKPHVADFGLAIKEADIGKGARFAGTPAYMSPEQARGEGHRVDGRSDIFSLSVVFYELLTGRRPFHADSQHELLEQVCSVEARPPRQWVDAIPKELERICLKAISKRAADRYTTAKDLADDLRHFLDGALARVSTSASDLQGLKTPGSPVAMMPTPTAPATPSDQKPLTIIPKGLRSFDAHDADFFLELLPGPRDRDGLPDSIRFWKMRIEEPDADNTFRVGLIYGPSGCGKSSLVKAGLLPRLSEKVIPVYLEATAEETETRLLNGLRRRCPIPTALNLKDTLAALRRGHGVPGGKKVLIVLDQFEQWLHAKRGDVNSELVQALRQCDGVRVQAIVMVRDDFWLAVSRFLRDLEVRLLEAQNSALVDLFPVAHAQKVLAAFGRAYGVLVDDQRLDPALQELLNRLEQLSDQCEELREGVHKAIQVADVDPEMALTRTRKVLEYVVRDVYERHVNEPAGTRPLENLLQRIVKDGYFPDRLDAYANTVRKLGNVGTHSFGERVTTTDVHHSLNQLRLILDWYIEVERPRALTGRPAPNRARRGSAGEPSSSVGTDQQQFLDQAIHALAQEGKVICVRLALFAELMKGRPWTPATLKAVGGAEGIGATFLEDTFSASTAPPEHRYHQKAARAVLKALLPEAGSDIKGHMRSHVELLEASDYTTRPKDFDALLHILDGELRLITPTDPEGAEGHTPRANSGASPVRFYQLTHDYLVPSLRDWLTRKQKETRRGRAELALADRAAVWNGRPENRQLPSLVQWLQIRTLTHETNWTAPQRKMMRKARRYHGARALMYAAVVIMLSVAGLSVRSRIVEHGRANHAAELVNRLMDAETAQVSQVVAAMADYRDLTDPILLHLFQTVPPGSREQLRVSLALLPGNSEAGQTGYLYDRIFDAEPREVLLIREMLLPREPRWTEILWEELLRVWEDSDRRFRAAVVLAAHTSEDARWTNVSSFVADRLVGQDALTLSIWAEALQPVGGHLLPKLARILADERRNVAQRSTSAVLYQKFANDVLESYAPLDKMLAEPTASSSWDGVRVALVKRQVNVGVGLASMGRTDKLWPLLKHTPDPTRRSFLIDRLTVGRVAPKALSDRYKVEPDVSIRRALLLSLGEDGLDQLRPLERMQLLSRLLRDYRDDPDSGIHGAVDWLFRQWQVNYKLNQWQVELKKIDAELATEKASRVASAPGARRWYINGQGQTMVIVPKPDVVELGEGQERSKHRINRAYAIAAKEVTVEQFLRFRQDHRQFKQYSPTPDCPMTEVSWHDAAGYCNWLNEREGITRDQWCYEPNDAGEYAEGMKLAANYLQRTGYRLPTEAEWEHACRAGADTGFGFGDPEELLLKHAWYGNSVSRTQPVGKLKPNDWGLFDMHGNVCEWCQNEYSSWQGGGETIEENEDPLTVMKDRSRVLRGGAFDNNATNARSGYRSKNGPASRSSNSGFRTARTFR